MSRYWVYLNGQVSGPFPVENLIRLPGFSRSTMICPEVENADPKDWISPAQIPELSNIFKTIDEMRQAGPPAPPKPAPKPRPQPQVRPQIVIVKRFPWEWFLYPLLAIVLSAAGYAGWRWYSATMVSEERAGIHALVNSARLAQGGTLKDYWERNGVSPAWKLEKEANGTYRVMVSGYPQDKNAVGVYVFEANLQALTVRGLNTAAKRLLAAAPTPTAPAPSATPKTNAPKPVAPDFDAALSDRMRAQSDGDFAAIWKGFSNRKRQEMESAGISLESFSRLQALRQGQELARQSSIEQTRAPTEKERWVLIRQTQDSRPDILVRQRWTLEDNTWKLDAEDKKNDVAPPASASSVPTGDTSSKEDPSAPTNPAPASDNDKPQASKSSARPVEREKVLTLPGISN